MNTNNDITVSINIDSARVPSQTTTLTIPHTLIQHLADAKNKNHFSQILLHYWQVAYSTIPVQLIEAVINHTQLFGIVIKNGTIIDYSTAMQQTIAAEKPLEQSIAIINTALSGIQKSLSDVISYDTDDKKYSINRYDTILQSLSAAAAVAPSQPDTSLELQQKYKGKIVVFKELQRVGFVRGNQSAIYGKVLDVNEDIATMAVLVPTKDKKDYEPIAIHYNTNNIVVIKTITPST